MPYKSICDQYFGGFFPAAFLSTAFATAAAYESVDINGLNAMSGAVVGLLGAAAGMFAHEVIDMSGYLRRRRVGVTRGGKIIRRAQAAAFAATVSVGAVCSHRIAEDIDSQQKDKPVLIQRKNTPPRFMP